MEFFEPLMKPNFCVMKEPAAVEVLSMLRPAHGQTELTKSTCGRTRVRMKLTDFLTFKKNFGKRK